MNNQTPILIASILFGLPLSAPAEEAGIVLVFQDSFDRKESQALKDEPGNDWTANSEARAKGNKQVFLRDGHVFIERHAEADHAATLNRSIDLKKWSRCAQTEVLRHQRQHSPELCRSTREVGARRAFVSHQYQPKAGDADRSQIRATEPEDPRGSLEENPERRAEGPVGEQEQVVRQ